MSLMRSLMVGLSAASLLAPVAYAADQPTPSAAQQAADRDFGRLSVDGAKAFRDVHAARLAIFDGQPDKAKQLIGDADTALAKAKNADSVFTKAESELKSPPNMNRNGASSANASTTPVKWLPVDGAMGLDENFVPSQQQANSLAKANAQIKAGNKKSAMETLRLANVDLTFDLEVVPLDPTLNGVAKAKQLVDAGQYYQANQALKGVEDGARFDTESFVDVPKTGRTANAAASSGMDKPAAVANRPTATEPASTEK